jgi:hypothetical protein
MLMTGFCRAKNMAKAIKHEADVDVKFSMRIE